MRNLHNYLQPVSLLLISWAIWQLTQTFAWGAISLGCFLFAWSVLAEMTKSSKRRRPAIENLREVA